VRTNAEPPVHLHPITRVALACFVFLQSLGGLSLYIFSERTDEFFAWTIGAPLTAALMGAAYWAALPTFLMALLSREWQRVRILFVSTFMFSLLVVAITLRHLDAFHLDSGPFLAQLAAWIWLVAYVAIPVLMLLGLILQERAGGSQEYDVSYPLDPLVRAGLILQALTLTTLGLALFFLPSQFRDIWPWPAPPLPAGAIAAWIFSFGCGSLWALREGDWQRIRITIPFYLLFYTFLLIAAVRFWDTFADADRRLVYVAILVGAILLTLLAAWRQERLAPATNEAVPAA
jgi:hypothetical protein